MSEMIFKIIGMTCMHCTSSVEKAVAVLPGITQVEVDLPKGRLTVQGTITRYAVIEAIDNIGFEVSDS